MAKYSVPKESLNQKVITCILYHDQKRKIKNLIEILSRNEPTDILIVLDGLSEIEEKDQLLKLNKNLNFLSFKQQKGISFCRNVALKYAKENEYFILIFIDSDAIPTNNFVSNHIKYHKEYENVPILGGGVIPSFLQKKTNIWQTLDGYMSWFCSVPLNKTVKINFPYHIATTNFSIKVSFLKKENLEFDIDQITGEDADFCLKTLKLNYSILLIPNSEVYHNDRENFRDFFNHQFDWSEHHYIRYKKMFLNHFKSKLVWIIFALIYFISIPITALIITILNIKPWLRKDKKIVPLIIPIYFIRIILCFYTLRGIYNKK